MFAEYPLVVSNDLKLVAEEVQDSFNNYLSVLDDKYQKLKWTILFVSFSYILLLAIAFISPLNSFFRQVIRAKSRGMLFTWLYLNFIISFTHCCEHFNLNT